MFNVDNMMNNDEKERLKSLGVIKKLRFQNKIINLINKYRTKLSKAGCNLYLEDKNRPISDYSESDQKVMLSIREEMRECIKNM
tara:strand:+ start:911 stop:1162 length:252 start_codon:yes stop_codon:yes gene_type:complete